MKSKTYDEFVEKFKPKLTTDDCYTPHVVYEAVADWAANEYEIDKSCFVRPFYPGGDYENFDYCGKIVVDNPPFSILSNIVKFYVERDIKFFLFAPTLVSIIRLSDICTALCVGVDIEYENGAVVTTGFVTNLEPSEIRMKTSPSLYAAVDTANKENQKSKNNNTDILDMIRLKKYIAGTDCTVKGSAADTQRDGLINSEALITPKRIIMQAI